MYTVDIKDFKGCRSARIEVEEGKIALLAGANNQGKSSILLACAATLVGLKMPCSQPGTLAKKYVHHGAHQGSAMLTLADGTGRRIVWTDGKVEMAGEAELIDEVSAGLERITDLKPEERAKCLISQLGAKVILKDFGEALTAAIGKERAKEIGMEMWKEVEALSFGSVLKAKEDEGRFQKRRWQEVSGKPKWSKESGNWYPEVWTSDLAEATVEQLAKVEAEAAQAVEEAIKSEAVNEEKLKELKVQALQAPGLTKAQEELKKAATDKAAELNVAKATLNGAPSPEQPKTHSCPECETRLVFEAGKLSKAWILTEAELKARKDYLEKAIAVVELKQKELAEIEMKHRDAGARLKEAQAASGQIDRIEKETKKDKGAKTLAETKEAYAQAQARSRAKRAKSDADQIHQLIMENLKIQELLSPDGLQKTKLKSKLVEFAAQYLLPVCETAGWGAVMIDTELAIRYGKHQDVYENISESEQFRVDVTLQAAFALMHGSPILLIDRADILVGEWRPGLMKLLAKHKLTAIVAMSTDDPKKVPDLAARGAGVTFWIRDGVATALAPVPA